MGYPKAKTDEYFLGGWTLGSAKAEMKADEPKQHEKKDVSIVVTPSYMEWWDQQEENTKIIMIAVAALVVIIIMVIIFKKT